MFELMLVFEVGNVIEKVLMICVYDSDNVVIVVNVCGLFVGMVLVDGIVFVEGVLQGYKVVLVDLVEGDVIICYNEVIGYVVKLLLCGSWVNEYVVKLLFVFVLDELLLVMCFDFKFVKFEGYMFEGYCNVDGMVGMKNVFGIMISV